MLRGEMNKLCRLLVLILLIMGSGAMARGVDVIVAGGVALRSWENYRGPSAHDNWWANFIRASTIRIAHIQRENPKARIVWIVFRPSYVTRGKENKIDYLSRIRETAKKYGVKLVYADTAEQTYKAINNAPRKGEKISSFFYFGHSNPYAFMLDYSNDIIGASTEWMHEKDLEHKIRRDIFAADADCWSYGCYTGRSMSRYWKKAFNVPLWGNLEATRYQPVGRGLLPEGAGMWKK